MRSSGLGGWNRKVVGGFFGLFCRWFQRSKVEAPKPLNAGVPRDPVARNRGADFVEHLVPSHYVRRSEVLDLTPRRR